MAGFILPIVMMIISDFRWRSVNLLWLICLFIVSVVVSILLGGIRDVVINVLTNCLLIIYLAVGVFLYFSIKARHWVNLLRCHFGVGDLIFLICLTPIFNIYHYLLFLTISFCITLALWGLCRLSGRINSTSIPLVSSVGIVFLVYIAIKILSNE